MDATFITIHDLSADAHILYSSDSIVDILGHTPDEVVNRSVWDFFHPDEVPVAKQLHNRGVKLDKAAVLSYCRIKNRQGDWVGCECCFSIVYDVMVCCTSVYRQGMNSQKRAAEAPIVRKLFSSSPKDPRYHMLSHLSSKFTLGPEDQTHEPRAALFLNRFTRTLTVMYATSGIEQIIGIPSDDMIGRSFYFCIAQNCLNDAVKCLESAKGNDSIAYMRFFFRDPRQDDPADPLTSESEDDIMTDITSSEDGSEAGTTNVEASTSRGESSHSRTETSSGETSNSHEVSGNSADRSIGRSEARSSGSSMAAGSPYSQARGEPIELEAVVSCTSDGLVVCLRRARPMQPTPIAQPAGNNGVFAAPWAEQPMFLPALPQQPPYPLGAMHPAMAQAPPSAVQSSFMQTIRDVAVFAWALVGINGSLAEYADPRANPVGESQPPDGFPIWDPVPGQRDKYSAAPSGYASGSGSSSNSGFGDPGLK
ncbi:hypothetical protein N0V90_009693 [Kalmusia sp. IMI 367209]|nr:hypothetical protein N0V90_009693 [Kalmusia sp. IMI 367209]